jgi:hypothetical protein
MNIRFDEKVVVRNNNIGGTSYKGWYDEERSDGFPFEKSKKFEITLQFFDTFLKV